MLLKNEPDLAEGLKSSTEKVGKLYPVLEDFFGNVIDGQHRLEADEDWPRIRLENVKTEKERIIARLVSNTCRRYVPAQEKTEMLDKLGEILLEEGVQPGEISKEISEETGMSYRWVMKYLQDKYKSRPQKHEFLTETSKVARRAANILRVLKPPREKLLEMAKYANTQHALYTVKKRLQEKIERAAEKVNTTPEVLVQNIIEEKLREFAALKQEDVEAIQHALEEDRV